MNRLTFFNARGWALAVACVMALGLSGAAQASSDKSSAKEEEKAGHAANRDGCPRALFETS